MARARETFPLFAEQHNCAWCCARVTSHERRRHNFQLKPHTRVRCSRNSLCVCFVCCALRRCFFGSRIENACCRCCSREILFFWRDRENAKTRGVEHEIGLARKCALCTPAHRPQTTTRMRTYKYYYNSSTQTERGCYAADSGWLAISIHLLQLLSSFVRRLRSSLVVLLCSCSFTHSNE